MVEGAFAQAFADALERRAVSLVWLHQRLVERGHPVSPAALSYWRSGRSQPERGTSRDALVEIERLLRVVPGSLVAKLGPSRRPGPRPAEKTLREMYAETPGMEEACAPWSSSGSTTSWSRSSGTSRWTSVPTAEPGRCRCAR